MHTYQKLDRNFFPPAGFFRSERPAIKKSNRALYDLLEDTRTRMEQGYVDHRKCHRNWRIYCSHLLNLDFLMLYAGHLNYDNVCASFNTVRTTLLLELM